MARKPADTGNDLAQTTSVPIELESYFYSYLRLFLSVFVLQPSITPRNMSHSALKTILQAHQVFLFFFFFGVVEVIDYRPGGEWWQRYLSLSVRLVME